MTRFADRIIGRTSGPIRGSATEANTWAVTKVHPGSVADAAGLKAGMLYRPSKPVALSPFALSERLKPGEVKSRFVDLAANEEIELTCTGFPFGVELAKAPGALAKDIVGNAFDVDLLAELLHGGDKDAISRLMTVVAQVQSGKNRGLGDIVKGWFAKGGAGGGTGADLDPNSYMGLVPQAKLAAAFWLAAHRKAPGARILLKAWEDWGVAGSGSAYQSIYYLTRALVREAEAGAGSDIKADLAEAYANAEESALVAEFWRDRQSEPPPGRATLVNRPFPRNYRLPAFDPVSAGSSAGAPFVSLADVYERLTPEQRLVVVALGPYRANGFYARILYRYQELLPVLGETYPHVHVLTAYADGNRHNPEWLMGEIVAKKRGADITILHDADGETTRALRIARSPHVFILDREGIVRYDGFMPDEGGFWQGLA